MSTRCMVVFCKSQGSIPGIKYFELTPERHDSWMRGIGRDPTAERLSAQNKICSLHFTKEDFITTHKGLVLKKDAVPKLIKSKTVLNSYVSKPNYFADRRLVRLKTGKIVCVSSKPETKSVVPKRVPKLIEQVVPSQPELVSVPKIAYSSNTNLEYKLCDCIKQEPNNVNLTEPPEKSGPKQCTNFVIPNTEELVKWTRVGTGTDPLDVSKESNRVEAENIIIEITEDDDDGDATRQQNQTIPNDSEGQNTDISNFNMESQVQVTFLASSDTEKESLLKTKLKELAENDVTKSRKIRELNNIIFIKNKTIDELKDEIVKLKACLATSNTNF